jgi:hypothetical protein
VFMKPTAASQSKKLYSGCGLYYKSLTIVIYNRNDFIIVKNDRNDSGQYYKTTITA